MAREQNERDRVRRRFLRTLGLLGAGAAAAGAGLADWSPGLGARAQAAAARAPGKHQWVMVIDLRKCDGCEKCTDACREMHFLPKDQSWIKVYKMESASGLKYAFPRPCQMCENPPCERVCPVGATFKDNEGIVLVDQDRCIGCRICMAACPYEARYFNFNPPPTVPADFPPATPEHPVPQQQGTVGKCVFCIHLMRAGQLPYCVDACTMEALYMGDLNQDLATNGRETVILSQFLKENDAIHYKEELGTKTRVFYILGHGQALNH